MIRALLFKLVRNNQLVKTVRVLLTVLLIAAFFVDIVVFPAPATADSIPLYWIGGSGAWSNTAHWSDSTGGAGGHAIPNATNNVIVDASSDTGSAVTISLTDTSYCNSLTFTSIDQIYAINGSYDMYVSGSITLSAGVTRSSYGFTFDSTSAGKTVTMGGASLTCALRWAGVGGVWTLQDALVDNYATYLDAGTLDTNDKAFTASYLSFSNTGTTALDFGSSVVSLVGGVWNATNLDSFTTTTSSMTVGGNFSGNGFTYYDVALMGAGVYAVTGANTFHNLTRTGTNTFTDGITFSADQVITNTLTLSGYSLTHRLQVGSSVAGTQRQLTVNGTNSITNCDISDIAGVGSAGWNISSGYNSDLGNNLGITFSTPTIVYWVANSGNWSDPAHWASTSGGAGGTGRIPLIQDTAVFNASSTTISGRTITIDITNLPNIEGSNMANNPTFSKAGTVDVYGNLNLGTCSWTVTTTNMKGLADATLIAYGAPVITTSLHILKTASAMSSVILASSFTVVGTVYLESGVLDIRSFNLTATAFDSSTTTFTRAFVGGSGVVTLNGTGVLNKWNVASSNLTFTPSSSTIVFTNSGVSTQTFIGAGLTYHDFTISGSGNYQTTITGTNTFADVTIDRSAAAKTLAGAVTMTVANLYLPPSGTTQITITNTDFTKVVGTVSGSYLTLSGSAAGGGATYLAGLAPPSVDGGGNSGWTFSAASAPTVTTDAATLLATTSATLNGNITSMGSYTGETVYVYFRYGPTPAYGNVTAEQVKSATGTFSLPITGLSTNTEYNYKAYIRYDSTLSAEGANITFTTLGAPIVTTLAATDVKATSATLQATVSTELYSDVYVRFEYGFSTSYGNTTSWQTFTVNSAFNSAIYSLIPSTTYHFRATGIYGVGSTITGSDLTFTTLTAAGTNLDQSMNRDRDVLPDIGTSDWFKDPDVSGTLLTNPVRPLVTMLSDTTTLNEIQAWRLYALALILVVTVSVAKTIPNHLFLAGVAAATAIGLAVSWTIFPMWALVFAIGSIGGGLVAERTTQL